MWLSRVQWWFNSTHGVIVFVSTHGRWWFNKV